MLGAPLSPGCPSADHQPCWRDVSPSPTGALARMQPTLPSAWDVGMRVIAVPDQCRRSQWGCGTWGASSIQGRWRQQPEHDTVLGSASLLVRGVGEQLNGGRGFSLHHLFVHVSHRAASAARVCGLVWLPPGEPLDVVVLVRARGVSWRPGCCSRRWHQFRVASSKFLHSSRTLFLLFCQPCLVRDFSAAQTCLRVPTATLSSCVVPRSQSQSDLGIKKLPCYFCEHPDLKLRALLMCDLTLGDHKIC